MDTDVEAGSEDGVSEWNTKARGSPVGTIAAMISAIQLKAGTWRGASDPVDDARC